eukprot:12415468-Ditylum_brightwellii.AAC.3
MRMTAHQLYRYFGNQSLQSFKEIQKTAQDSVTVANMGKLFLEIGDVARIKTSNRSKEAIPLS